MPTLALNVSKSTWIIAVPSGQKIAAKFTRMKLSKANGDQCDDYVEIKDGLFGKNQRFLIVVIVGTQAFEGRGGNIILRKVAGLCIWHINQ